jgi:tripartite-type tricarboxylate transporter receptor subunit TctC
MRTLLLLAFCAASSLAVPAQAQNYPTRPITIAVPTPPGGPMDTMMRAVADKMSETMGQPVIIENKTGAGGVLASSSALASPDGYTIAGIYLSHATNIFFNPKLPYDTLKDFAPVALVAKGPLVLLVNKSVPAKNVAELITYVKARPGQLNIGASAMGGASHLGAELFKSMAGLDMPTVPYRGTAVMISDILSGRVQVTIDSYLQYVPYAQSGAIRFLAVSTPNRFENDPSIPTIAETVPGYDATAWWGLAVSSATPPAIVAKIHDGVVRALADKGVQEKIRALGISPGGGSQAEFTALIKSEIDKWGKLIKSAHLAIK